MKKTPPKHLHPETQRWWRSVVKEWQLDEHHLKLLTLAGESWDRCNQAREALAANGTTFQDRFNQPRARPEIAIERDSRIQFARLLRELDLDSGVSEPLRPPALLSNRGLAAVRGGKRAA